MVRSAQDYIRILEGFKFYDIVVSLKASDILDTIRAYRMMAGLCDYPFHLGVTATGPSDIGAIKSSIAVSNLLLEGIGDTIRISLTDKPQEEVRVAKAILETLNLRHFGPQIISCPTCGRCEVDLVKIVKEIDRGITQSTVHGPQSIDKNYRLSTIDYRLPLKVAIMGCVVNGPGEAKEADIGVAFGKKEGILFRKGKFVRKISFANCVDVLLKGLGE
jgi:(E)-4-hydroxy-3-methylbut-2-enyl-diphosphate synthase